MGTLTAMQAWPQRALVFPGVLACAVVAAAATFLQHHGAPVMLFALLLGAAMNFLSDDGAHPGSSSAHARCFGWASRCSACASRRHRSPRSAGGRWRWCSWPWRRPSSSASSLPGCSASEHVRAALRRHRSRSAAHRPLSRWPPFGASSEGCGRRCSRWSASPALSTLANRLPDAGPRARFLPAQPRGATIHGRRWSAPATRCRRPATSLPSSSSARRDCCR